MEDIKKEEVIEKEYYTKAEVDSIVSSKLMQAMNDYIERVGSLTKKEEVKEQPKELTEKDFNF